MNIDQYYKERFLNKHQITASTINSVAALAELPDSSTSLLVIDGLLNQELDYESVIKLAHTKLATGGTLYAILSSIAPTVSDGKKSYWGFALAGASYMFKKYFGEKDIEVEGYGNVLVGRMYMNGSLVEDLSEKELLYSDPFYPVIIGVKVTK